MEYKLNQYYRVLCAKVKITKTIWAVPVYPILHSDMESGQMYKHFHADTRFISKKHLYKNLAYLLRLREEDVIQTFYARRKFYRGEEIYPTHISNISYKVLGKLQNKVVKNFKCPHRGYDLSNVKPTMTECGLMVKCPLHGLEFKYSNYNQLIVKE